MFRRWRKTLLWLIVLAGAAWGGYAYWTRSQAQHAARESLPAQTAAVRDKSIFVVTAQPVTLREVQRKVEAVGTLRGFEEVTISAKTEGRVKRLLRDVSDRVKPGELLIEIDPTDYELAVRQAEKTLQVEMAKLGVQEPPGPNFDVKQLPAVQQAVARLDNAKLRVDRVQAAGGAVSQEDTADKRADLRVAEAEYQNQIMMMKAGLATIQMKQEALAMSRQQLNDTKIYAATPMLAVPLLQHGITYVITHRPVAEGSFVRVGTELCKLVIDQALKLRLPVPERYISEVKLGQEAAVFSVAYPTAFRGVVARINPAIEPATRTFEVEVVVPNLEMRLRPGGFARAHLLIKKQSDTVTVPLTALVTFAGITKIFVLENNTAREVVVTLGEQTDEWAEIVTPALKPGTVVITSGQTALANGAKVEVRKKP